MVVAVVVTVEIAVVVVVTVVVTLLGISVSSRYTTATLWPPQYSALLPSQVLDSQEASEISTAYEAIELLQKQAKPGLLQQRSVGFHPNSDRRVRSLLTGINCKKCGTTVCGTRSDSERCAVEKCFHSEDSSASYIVEAA